MAVTPDLNQIAIVMSQLQHNYSQLAQNWFDIFYNSEAKNVTITFYDEIGNLETYTIPNRAKDFNNIRNGQGSPENAVVADVGTVYQDLLNGEAYLKKTGTGNVGWVKFISATDLDSIIRKGGVTPEGNIVGSTGDLYVNNVTGYLYIKTGGTGNTGWTVIGGTIPTKISDLTDDTATNPIDKADTLTNLTATVTELNVLDGITATTTELNYMDGVTSNVQTQIDAKQDTLTYTPVNKAGDTMTGVLTVNVNADDALILKGKVPVSTSVGNQHIVCKNTSNNLVGALGFTHSSANQNGVSLVVGRPDTGVNMGGFEIACDSTGSLSCSAESGIKHSINSWSFPSNTYQNLSWTTGAQYTAPANGWFVVKGQFAEGGVTLYNISSGLGNSVANNAGATSDGYASIPVLKGHVVQTYLTYGGATISYFRFVYANGEPTS